MAVHVMKLALELIGGSYSPAAKCVSTPGCRFVLWDILLNLMDEYGEGPGTVNDRLMAEYKATLRQRMRSNGLLPPSGSGESGVDGLKVHLLRRTGWQLGNRSHPLVPCQIEGMQHSIKFMFPTCSCNQHTKATAKGTCCISAPVLVFVLLQPQPLHQ